MSLDNAVDVIGRGRDQDARKRAYVGVLQLLSIARRWPNIKRLSEDAQEVLDIFQSRLDRNVAYARLTGSRAFQSRLNPDRQDQLDQPIQPIQPDQSSRLKRFFNSCCDILSRDGKSPCAYPTSKAVINSDSDALETTLDSEFIIKDPLDDVLAKALDPCNWFMTGLLFARTDRLHEKPVGAVPPPGDSPSLPWLIGKPGYLFERAKSGFQEIENILTIKYTKDLTSGDRDSVYINYDLFRGESYRVAGIEMAGLMRRNDGYLRARRYDGNKKWTEVKVKKTVRYGRVSSWSGSGMVDYGEVLNYAARAFLIEWVNHLALVPPCGVGLK